MLGIIIQARLGSSRLPNKILKPFAGTTILMFLIQRLKTLQLPVIVATTTSDSDNYLCNYLEKNDIKYFRGDESNVLNRFVAAAEEYNFSDIIRICSDNPLIDIEKIQELINIWKSTDTNYLSFSYEGIPTVLCHYGAFSELTTLETLKMLENKYTDNSYYAEHVTAGIYSNADTFRVTLIELPSCFSRYNDIRITVDTWRDYENLIYIYEKIPGVIGMSFSDIAEKILERDEIMENMRYTIKNNKKNNYGKS